MSDKIQYAGEFVLEEVVLITHGNKELDITEQVTEIDIFEEIQSTSISAAITVLDTHNVVANAPIMGHEYVRVIVKTPGFEEPGDINFSEHVFVVYSLAYRADKDQSAVYIIRLTTPELLKNERVRVSQAYEGPLSETVKLIYEDPLYLNCKKNLVVEPTLENHKIVIPNMHPFQAIRMLGQRSVSAANPRSMNYVFYETTKGFNFRSMDSLFEKTPLTEGTPGYTAGLPDDYEKEGLTPIQKSFLRIENFEIVNSTDIISNIRSGLYGSKLIAHDAYNKNYQVFEYAYGDEFDSDVHLDEFKVFPTDSPVDETGLTSSDYPDARLHLTSTSGIDNTDPSGKMFALGVYPEAEQPFVNNNMQTWFLPRQSRLMQLNRGFGMRLTVNGNTAMQAGDIIQINIPLSSTKSAADDEFDAFYSGLYVITKMRHIFKMGASKRHRCVMEVYKESVRTEVPAQLPTMTQGSGSITEI